MKRLVLLLTTLVFPHVFLLSDAAAQPIDSSIPPALKPWVEWVKEKNPERSCSLVGAERVCAWTGKVALELGASGGTFQMTAFLERKERITLPGGGEVWPLDVTGDSRALAVLAEEGKPTVVLEKGRHVISGRFAWSDSPRSLALPADVGLVDLKISGAKVALPKVTENGELWLQEEGEEDGGEAAVEDNVQYSVSRKLIDGVPFHIVTRLELRISGRPRELALGNILMNGSKPLSVQSGLAYKLDESWNLTLQGKPGIFQVTIDAVLPEPPAKLGVPAVKVEGWPAEEFWALQPNPEFRAVDLSGPAAIDPNRTRLPDEWKSLAAYVVTAKEETVFNETRRGEPEVPPNRLELYRRAWLDLDGGGFTLSDQLNGQMNRDWRLDMQPGTALTRVTVNGTDQVITAGLESKLPGVELRSENVAVQSVSRIENSASTIPAVGWNHDVNSLRVDLNVGPGWTLLEAIGADNDAGTWLSTWRLWDIFFVCLMAIAAGKLLGRRIGLVTFLALALCHGQYGAPVYIWLNLLAGTALLEVLPAGRFKRIVQIYYFLSFGLVLSILIPFSIDQIRLGLYPQLTPAFQPGEIFTMILGPTLVLSAIAAFIASIIFLFRKMFKYAFQLFFLAATLVVTSIVVVAIFGGIIGGAASRNMRIAEFGGAGGADYAASVTAPAPQAVPADRLLARKGKAVSGIASELAYQTEQSLSMDEGGAPVEKFEALRQQLVQVDPKAVVQTGSATPAWQWRTWNLIWNGPVEKSRTIDLYLLSPRMNCILSFLRVGLLAALACSFLTVFGWRKAAEKMLPALILMVFAHALSSPDAALADDFPNEALLTELEERIYRDSCASDCTTVSSIRIDVAGEELTIMATVSNEGTGGAWPIPGPLDQLNPTSVSVGKEMAAEFRRSPDGLVWVRVPAGTHEVVVKASVRGKNELTLQFGMTPAHAEVRASGWSVDGVGPTGAPEDTIQLIRSAMVQEERTEKDAADEIRLADWNIFTREIDIALPWTVANSIDRLGDVDRAQIVKVPLLKGESVTGAAVKVEGGIAIVTLPRNERRIQWTSTFAEAPQVDLTALKDGALSENWIVRCSAIWRCSFEGISPVRSRDQGEAARIYRPWPGEKLSVKVARPEGINGDTATIDAVTTLWRPGTGLLQGNLDITLRSSQGGWRKIKLPEGAKLEGVSLNGTAQTLALEGRDLALPISPGQQQFTVNWRQDWSSGLLERMPEVNLGMASSNHRTTVNVPERRWLLWVGGPAWGPAVLFWGELIVVVLFGLLLGRLKVPPLKGWQWILLGLGMATLHPAFMLLPAVCFWLLALRTRTVPDERWKFNAFQILLAVISLVTIVVLFLSIYHGLIVEPDMGISGNYSTNTTLNWFVDRSGAELARPWILSLPLWIWRLLMLCWSSWLVFAILRWMKWGWKSFSHDGFWRGKIEAA